MSIRQQLEDAMDAHCRAVGEYQDARIMVAAWETYGVITPGEVERLEQSLANLYRCIHRQSEQLARISSNLEFRE